MSVQRLSFWSPSASAGPEEAARLRSWWDEYRAMLEGIEVHVGSGVVSP